MQVPHANSSKFAYKHYYYGTVYSNIQHCSPPQLTEVKETEPILTHGLDVRFSCVSSHFRKVAVNVHLVLFISS